MRELRPLSDRALKQAYDTLYREAFPRMELRPFRSILEMTKQGDYRTLGWYDGGALLGCVSLWSGDGGCVLLDYLVVPEEKRGGGIGEAILRAPPELYPPDTVFLIELLKRYAALYRRHTPDWLWKKMIRIPLESGEEIPVFDEWDGEAEE